MNNMKHVLRYTAVAIVCLIVLSSIILQVSADENNYPRWYKNGGPYNPDLYGKLGGNLFNMFWNKFLPLYGAIRYKESWYMVGSGPYPKHFYADPDYIEVDYLGNTTVDLVWGVENPERRPYHRFQSNVYPEFTLVYDVVFPEGIPEDAFHAVFDPPTFDILEYHAEVGGTNAEAPQPATKLTLFLDLPGDPGNPIQDFILRINVSIYKKYGDLISPPILGGDGFGIGAFTGKFWRANFEADIGHKNFSLLVKVKPFRNAELYVPSLVNMHLNDCRTAQIQVQNRGSHIEQFGFRVNGEDDSLLVNTPSPITLAPGEIRYVAVGLITKPIAYDRGTLHSVSVEVYSCDQPNVTLSSGILSVRTKGFVLSSIPTIEYFWHIFFAGLIIFFFAILILINRRRKLARICKKPEKPWKHYNERGHLEGLLKEKKVEKYKRTLEMMKEEYNSALLWYKDYRNFLIKERRKQGKLKKLLSGTSSRGSNVSKKTEQEPVVQPGAKEQKIKPKAIRTKPKEITRDDGREKTLQKIRRQQQKQKKKLGI
jgi:hypothetical protein